MDRPVATAPHPADAGEGVPDQVPEAPDDRPSLPTNSTSWVSKGAPPSSPSERIREQLDGGYSDIRTGASVLVRDREGVVLGSGTLGAGLGTIREGTFRFEVTVPDADLSLVELGRRGSVPFARDQLDRDGNRVRLSWG